MKYVLDFQVYYSMLIYERDFTIACFLVFTGNERLKIIFKKLEEELRIQNEARGKCKNT